MKCYATNTRRNVVFYILPGSKLLAVTVATSGILHEFHVIINYVITCIVHKELKNEKQHWL